MLICFIVVLLSASFVGADVVTDWNDLVLETIKQNDLRPTESTRTLAMVHAAIYDAVNAIDKTHEVYFVEAPVKYPVSREAAAAAAAHRILTTLFPDESDIYDEELDSTLSRISNQKAKKHGIALGRYVADAIIEWRSDDGSDLMAPYDPKIRPGIWRPTPPAFADPVGTNWLYVTPFAMTSAAQFRPGPPPDLRSWDYAAALNEVKVLGALHSPYRNREQTEIAYFWADDFESVSPPGRWNVIAEIIAERYDNTLSENARLFALLNIGLADACICAWDCKYTYDLWRPITAIREADTDRNHWTVPDRHWKPLLTTPAFPEYTSGHSTFGATAAVIMAHFFGSDNICFKLESTSPNAGPRTFRSLSQAASENGISRIYGGLHFSFANVEGLKAGRKIANYVYANSLRPVDSNMRSGPKVSAQTTDQDVID